MRRLAARSGGGVGAARYEYEHVEKSRSPPLCDAVYRYVSPRGLVDDQRKEIGNLQRYRDNGELRFSMRSFAQVDGLRTFHVVAKGSAPDWLQTSHARVRWWDEMALLEALRLERGIESKIKILSGEPSKLAIALIPPESLAERFLLLDDDYFIVPPSAGLHLSTGLFFDVHGVPLHPETLANAHRPIPMLRDAYADAVSSTPTEDVAAMLQQGTNRTDYLPRWAMSMRRNASAARAVSVAVRTPNEVLFNYSLSERQKSPFTLYWLKQSMQQMHRGPLRARDATPFFRSIRVLRPMFICINDNWPSDPDEYRAATAPMRAFLSEMFPTPEAWEKTSPETLDDSGQQRTWA